MRCLCNVMVELCSDREKRRVMPLLLSRLAPGCQTQPGPSGRRSEPSDGPAPLREAWGPRSLSSLHLNELGVTDWQFFCSDTEQSRGDRDEAFEASRWKQDVWLAACMSLGRVWTPVCHPASLSWHQRFLSVDRQHFHTHSDFNQSQSRQSTGFFWTVRSFHILTEMPLQQIWLWVLHLIAVSKMYN